MVNAKLYLTSWQEWKAFLADNGPIRDEYGREVSMAEFVDLVEKHFSPTSIFQPSGKALKCHYDAVGSMDGSEWKDAAGYSFSDREFS